MKKTVREWMQDRRLAVALAALAVLLVIYRLTPGSAGKAPVVSPPPAPGTGQPQGIPAPAQPPAEAGTPAPPARSTGEIAWSWGRNPFLPQWRERGAGGIAAVAESQAGAEGLSGLRGTVISGNSGIAIFGNRLVPIGGRIDRWMVERVDPYAVTLRSANEIRVVELFKPAPTGGKGRGGDR